MLDRAFNAIIGLGLREGQSFHQRQLIKATNFLNLIVVLCIIVGFTNYFFLGNQFPFPVIFSFFVLAVASLFLSGYGFTRTAFMCFTLNVNVSIFFISEYYPFGSGSYLYYFPLVVSVILLNNPTFRDRLSLIHLILSALFFVTSLVLDFPEIQLRDIDEENVRSLWYCNVILSVVATGVLAALFSGIISRQNAEITLQNEDLLKARETVNNSLREKEMLLAELHHRVKNNLAIISGLLNLQEDATDNDDARRIISDSRHRIMSMAMVHRMLYGSHDLKSISIGSYCRELIDELFNSYNLTSRVKVDAEYDEIWLPVNKSIPLGLILNEAVTNSIKYVFKAEQKNDVKHSVRQRSYYVRVKVGAGKVNIILKDDGAGFPDDYNQATHPSLGIYLIKTLSEQIDGTVTFSNDNGARIDLCFAH